MSGVGQGEPNTDERGKSIHQTTPRAERLRQARPTGRSKRDDDANGAQRPTGNDDASSLPLS